LKGRAALVLALLAAAAPVAIHASAPGKSLRPVLRPAPVQQTRPNSMIVITQAPGVRVSIRPVSRPEVQQVVHIAATRANPPASTQAAPVLASARGSVCRVRAIKGQNLSRIPGRLPGCGIKSPVRVTSVSGVALSQPATMDCTTAKALNNWVKNGVKPIIGRLGGGAVSLQVIAGYSCRTRNSQPGAKISEHGKGRAIDISAINLKNGSSLSVLTGWKKRREGKLLKSLHRAACGPFGTVLGPDANRFHRDHFHLDTARYRGPLSGRQLLPLAPD